MNDAKWLLTEVEVHKLLRDRFPVDLFSLLPIGYNIAIKMGAKEQLAKLRRLGWQDPFTQGDSEFNIGDILLVLANEFEKDKTYLWTKRGMIELKPCEVRVVGEKKDK